MNLRSEASTSSAILATMAHGTQVTLLEMGSAWSRVQYGTLSGYVKNEYISVIDDAVDETPEGVTSIGGSAFYNCTSLTSITIPEGGALAPAPRPDADGAGAL